jgi:hypothetical protein
VSRGSGGVGTVVGLWRYPVKSMMSEEQLAVGDAYSAVIVPALGGT